MKAWSVWLFDLLVLESEGSLIPVVCRNALSPRLTGAHLLFAHEIRKEIRLMIEEISLKLLLSESVGDKNKQQNRARLF